MEQLQAGSADVFFAVRKIALYDVVLFDKVKHPRYSVGESIIPHFGKYCEGGFHVIRNYSYKPMRVAGPGFFLVGDAAVFIDPIFSLGVVLAMFSASSTVWAIDRCFKHPDRIADSQALLTSYIARRLEVGRALALPRYGYGGDEAQMVTTAIQYEAALEQELMYVVSMMTTRSENFTALSRSRKGGMITSDKYRVLESIQF